MLKPYAEAIVAAADCLGEDLRLYEDYSGRGGSAPSTGVTGNRGTIIQCIALAAYNMGQDGSDLGDEFVEMLGNLRWDNLGRDSIAY